MKTYKDIKTVDDAIEHLGLNADEVDADLVYLQHLENNLGNHLTSIYKIDIIRQALNGNLDNITDGAYYYAYLSIYPESEVLQERNIIGKFIADGKTYIATFNDIYLHKGGGGILGVEFQKSMIHKHFVGYTEAQVGLFACKSAEIAKHFSKYFGKLIFDACYGQYVGQYKWIE